MLNKTKSEIMGTLSASIDKVVLKLLNDENINRLLTSVINMFRAQNCERDTDITSKDSFYQVARYNADTNKLQGSTDQQIKAIESAMRGLIKLQHLKDLKTK